MQDIKDSKWARIQQLEQKITNWPLLKPVVRWASAALVVAVLGAMLIVLWQVRHELLAVLKQVNFGWLAVALGVNVLSTIGYCAIWYFVERSLLARIKYRETVAIVSISSAGRYLPGGIWSALMLIGVSRRAGMSIVAITVLFGLAQGIHILLASCISMNGLGWLSNGSVEGWRSGLVSILSLGLVLGVVLGYKRYLQPIIKRLPTLGAQTRLNRKELSWAVLSSLSVWLLCGVRLALILLACQANLLPNEPLRLILFLTWAAAISGIAISLFFFVPLGLGAVELSLATFLGLLTNDWPLIVAVLLLNRVVQMVNDFMVVSYSLYYLKRSSTELNKIEQ